MNAIYLEFTKFERLDDNLDPVTGEDSGPRYGYVLWDADSLYWDHFAIDCDSRKKALDVIAEFKEDSFHVAVLKAVIKHGTLAAQDILVGAQAVGGVYINETFYSWERIATAF